MASNGLLPRIVELAATYLVQSALFLLAAVGVSSLLRKGRTRQLSTPQPILGMSPAFAERLWRMAAVLAVFTAPISVLTGWTQPTWQWSFRESLSLPVESQSRATRDKEIAIVSEASLSVMTPDQPHSFVAPIDIDFEGSKAPGIPADTPARFSMSFVSPQPSITDISEQRITGEQLMIESPAVESSTQEMIDHLRPESPFNWCKLGRRRHSLARRGDLGMVRCFDLPTHHQDGHAQPLSGSVSADYR